MANGKWEFGVVSWHEPFTPVDQVTRLSSEYATPSTLTTPSLSLDSSISSDYTGAPFHLWGRLTGSNTVEGAPGYVGPSTNASYDGSIEDFVTYQTGADSGVANTAVKLGVKTSFHDFGIPYSTYAANDPVIFRTMPAGWNPTGTLEAKNIGVMPIGRHRESFSVWRDTNSSDDNAVNMTSENAYKYLNKYGVRLVSDGNSSDDNTRNIYKLTPVNSIDPHIRRYRVIWSYRMGKANAMTGTDNPTGRVTVTVEACDASGAALTTLQNETTGLDTSYTLFNKPSISSSDTDWTTAYALVSGNHSTDNTNTLNSVSNWIYRPNNDQFHGTPFTRMNRWKFFVRFRQGVNCFFDMDDLIVEHAHGTSQEGNGFYEVNDYPTAGSLSWSLRRGATAIKNQLANNTMKINQTSGDKTPKHIVSAQFNNVSRQTYDDFRTMEEWQKRNHMISFRPFHNGLPDVMCGYLTLSNFNNEMPDLDRVSFSMNFEEA